MKIIIQTEWQMTPKGYELLSEDSYEYIGPLSEAKGAKDIIGNVADPGGIFHDNSSESGLPGYDYGLFDPLNIGGQGGMNFEGETAAQKAKQAQADLPGQLAHLNQMQADVSRYNTSGPFGSSSWSVDPKTGHYSQDISLAPSEQRQFDLRNKIAEQMMDKAQDFAPASSSSFDYNSEVPALANQQYAKTQSLIQPIQQQDQAAWEGKMNNMGLSPMSDAYKEAAAQRTTDLGQAQSLAKYGATTAAIPLAQQQRQQRMTELAQLLGGQQLNSPALGGTGVDVTGATNAANQVGIQKANEAAAQRNATMQGIAQLLQSGAGAYFGG